MHYSCKICRSNYRDVIESAVQDSRLPYREVARRFIKQFDCSIHSLELSVSNHHKKHTERRLCYENLVYLERIRRGEVNPIEVADFMEYLLKKADY